MKCITVKHYKYSSVHINESRVLHNTEVTSFLTDRRFLKPDYFNQHQQLVFRVTSEIEFGAI